MPAAPLARAEVELSLGQASGQPGDTVSVDLTAEGAFSAMQLDIVFDPGVLNPVSLEGFGLAEHQVLDWEPIESGRIRVVASLTAKGSLSLDPERKIGGALGFGGYEIPIFDKTLLTIQ